MKTRSWQPRGQQESAVGSTTDDVLLSENLYFSEDSEPPTQCTVFGAIYLAIVCLRQTRPFAIARENGHELFRYDGERSTYDTAFAEAMTSCEFFMLEEQKLGWRNAMASLDRTGEAAPAQPPADAAQADESPRETVIRRRR